LSAPKATAFDTGAVNRFEADDLVSNFDQMATAKECMQVLAVGHM
jgi:hypothetical protein